MILFLGINGLYLQIKRNPGTIIYRSIITTLLLLLSINSVKRDMKMQQNAIRLAAKEQITPRNKQINFDKE